ncbi:unnamed protein product [Ectocarpus fasciculatus]
MKDTRPYHAHLCQPASAITRLGRCVLSLSRPRPHSLKRLSGCSFVCCSFQPCAYGQKSARARNAICCIMHAVVSTNGDTLFFLEGSPFVTFALDLGPAHHMSALLHTHRQCSSRLSTHSSPLSENQHLSCVRYCSRSP